MCKALNILLITSFYPPPWGACAVRCYYFVKAFREKGWKVDVLVPIQPNRKERISIGDSGERILRFKFYTIPRSLLFDYHSAIIGSLRILRKTRNIGLKHRYDVVVATTPPPDTVIIAHSLIRRMNMAHRLTADIRDDVESIVKELFSYRSPLSVFQATIAKASLPFYYKVLKECNLVIAATRGLASHYCKLLGKNVEIIYNGADFQHFRNLTSKERNERRGGIVIADLNAEYQKLDIIIRAIDILSKQDIELPFTIVGNGHYRRTYEDLCKRLDVKSVRFVGYVPYPNLPYLLRTASFGVVGRPIDKNVQLLSTLTNKFFEYIASGLPVFAYGSSGSEVEEFIQTYRLGTYVESNDPFVIATELRRFLSLNFNRKHLLNVAKEFDRTRWAKRLCELIERSL